MQKIYAFIAEYSPLQGIREIYGKLYALNLWGYSLTTAQGEIPDFDQALIQFTHTLIQALKAHNADLFAKTMGTFVKKAYALARSALLAQGFTQKDLSLSPSFTLLNTETV